MTNGVPAVKAARSTGVNAPHGAVVILAGHTTLGSLPATYRVFPFRKAVVPPDGSGRGAEGTGGSTVRSTLTKLAWVPPHSAPQFRTYMEVLSALPIANTG